MIYKSCHLTNDFFIFSFYFDYVYMLQLLNGYMDGFSSGRSAISGKVYLFLFLQNTIWSLGTLELRSTNGCCQTKARNTVPILSQSIFVWLSHSYTSLLYQPDYVVIERDSTWLFNRKYWLERLDINNTKTTLLTMIILLTWNASVHEYFCLKNMY